MPYLIQYRYGTVRIAACRKPAALGRIHDLVETPDFARDLATVRRRARVRAAQTLESALAAFDWGCSTKDNGDIQAAWPIADELGDSEELLRVLVPFIAPGSCVEFAGEDNDVWRWTFTGTNMVESYPEIAWPPISGVSRFDFMAAVRGALRGLRPRRRSA